MTQPIKTKPTDDGGSAFPHGEIIAEQHDSAGNFSGNIVHHESAGMSLRDWFAGMALQGLFASGHFTKTSEIDGSWMTTHEDPYDDETNEKIHKGRRRYDFPGAAWRAADAMLEFRKAKP
jgi:hypothetical protein